MWFWSTALRADKKGVKLYSNDLNLDCYNYYLNKNILMNRIKKSDLLTFNIDAREFIRMCINHADDESHCENYSNLFEKNKKINHFYMNLPKDAIEFLDCFQGAFENKKYLYNKDNLPIVHVYGFSNSENPKEDLISRVCKAFNIEKLSDENLLEIVNIRDVSTKKHMFSISIKIPSEVAFK